MFYNDNRYNSLSNIERVILRMRGTLVQNIYITQHIERSREYDPGQTHEIHPDPLDEI